MLTNFRYICLRATNLSSKYRPCTLIKRSISSTDPPSPAEVEGLFKYSRLQDKSYVKVRGPDAVKFINGLVTSKLEETFVKKNLTTISDNSKSGSSTIRSSNKIPILQFDITKGNWGLYHENSGSEPYISRFGQYTGLLDGKGKLVTDTIIYPTPISFSDINSTKYPEYLIEFDTKMMIDKMLHSLEAHKLLSKVKIQKIGNEKINTWDCYIRFSNIPESEENPWIDNILAPMKLMKIPADALNFANAVIGTLFNGFEKNILGVYVERRTDAILRTDGSAPLLFRILTDDTVDDISKIFNQNAFPFKFNISEEMVTFFRKIRLNHGLLDGPMDVKPGTTLPLELNFDYYPDVVSSNKGCYVGQELTARSFSTGILRKRLIPVILDNVDALKAIIEKEGIESEKYLEVEMSSNKVEEKEVTNVNSALSTNPFGSNKTVRKRKRPVGSLISFESNAGVILLRTEYFDKIFGKDIPTSERAQLYIQGAQDNSDLKVIIKPLEPFWLKDWFKTNKPKF